MSMSGGPVSLGHELRLLVGDRKVGLRLSGGAVGGSEEADRIRDLGHRLLPPYPGEGVIKPIVVPPPQPLPPSSELVTYAQCVEQLAGWYRGVLRDRFGYVSGFGGSDVRKMKDYRKLCDFVDELVKAQVPPASWVLFSFDVWAEYGRTGGPPTVAWVFSLNRLRENRKWFEDKQARYFGGRTYFAEEHIELVHKWRMMWDAVMVARPQTREQLLVVVDRFFPGTSYEKAVNAAQVSTRRLEQYLREAVEQGRPVWG